MININLIPIARIERRARQRRIAAWTAGLTVYASVVAVGALAIHAPADEGIMRMRSQTQNALAEADNAQSQRAETMKTVSDLARRLEASRTIGVHPDWSVLIRSISSLRGDSVVLASIEITESEEFKPVASKPAAQTPAAAAGTPADAAKQAKAAQEAREKKVAYTVRLTGMGAKYLDVMAFVRKLEKDLPLQEITVVDTRAMTAGEGELTSFELRAKLAEVEESKP